MGNDKPRVLLPREAAAGVQRTLRDWINGSDKIPASAGTVSFENLTENESGLCIATIQAPAYAARYITGGYRAEYRFRIIYRVLPSDDDDILDAVEALGELGAWCETAEAPTLEGAVNVQIRLESDVALLVPYQDGCNDYAINLILTWEVF